MITEDKIKQIKEFADGFYSKDPDSAHNIEHVMRVYNIALSLAKGEDVDLDVIKIAILLHDIGGSVEESDSSGKIDHAKVSVELSEPFLKSFSLPDEKIRHILDCICRIGTEQKINPRLKKQ